VRQDRKKAAEFCILSATAAEFFINAMSFVSGPFAAAAQQVLRDDRVGRPINTSKIYDGRVKEFIDFCMAKYPSRGRGADSPTTVTEEKLFGFLFYQSRRPPRSLKGRKNKKKQTTDREDEEEQEVLDGSFNENEYDYYMAQENLHLCASKPIGYSVINHYMCSILDLHQQQVDNGCNNITKAQLRSNRVQKLLANVKIRKVAISKENFEERLTTEFAPYTVANEIPRLENELFERNSHSTILCIASFRDRMCLLQTISGILRGESMFKADLSDTCDLVHNHSSSSQSIHISVLRIATGKTNENRILYGRCIRHRAVERCAIGGQAFYFYARFLYTKELDEIDFSKNSDWFNIKLCTDCRTQNNTTGLNDKTYYKSIKSACEKLSIPSKHFIHFGRSCGSVLAELEELDGYNINDLGNWNVDTRRDVYSAKLPMKAMRVMAGHSEQKGSVFVARDQVIPERFSRLKMIITRLRTILERNENTITPEDLLTYVDGWYSKSNENFTVAGFDKKLKKFLDNGASDLEAPWN
jgi:hypothetical protein